MLKVCPPFCNCTQLSIKSRVGMRGRKEGELSGNSFFKISEAVVDSVGNTRRN